MIININHKKNIRRETGTTIIEIVIATAVLGIILSALGSTLMYGIRNSEFGGKRERATFLANEGLEAVRNIRDEDFVNLVDGTHGLAVFGNQWTFSGSQDAIGDFTRETSITTVDANTKEVTTTITWDGMSTRPGTVSTTTRFCDWGIIITPPVCDWSGGSQLLSNLNLAGGQHGLKIQSEGDYGYLVRDGGIPDFVVIDITDISNPLEAGSMNLPDNPRNIVLANNLAYVASSHNSQELQIVDISDPLSLSVVGTYNANRNSDANGIDINGTTVYLTKRSSNREELFIIDASTPSSPSLLGALNLNSTANEVKVLGNYAYIASNRNNQELQVVDVSNPSSLSIDGSYNLSGNRNGISVAGFDDIILLGRAGGGFHVFDVSTPTSPVELGWYNAGGTINDIALGNNNTLAALATDDNSAEFQLIDITDTANPSLYGSYNATNNLNGITYNQDKCGAFAASRSNTAEFMIFIPL